MHTHACITLITFMLVTAGRARTVQLQDVRTAAAAAACDGRGGHVKSRPCMRMRPRPAAVPRWLAGCMHWRAVSHITSYGTQRERERDARPCLHVRGAEGFERGAGSSVGSKRTSPTRSPLLYRMSCTRQRGGPRRQSEQAMHSWSSQDENASTPPSGSSLQYAWTE